MSQTSALSSLARDGSHPTGQSLWADNLSHPRDPNVATNTASSDLVEIRQALPHPRAGATTDVIDGDDVVSTSGAAIERDATSTSVPDNGLSASSIAPRSDAITRRLVVTDSVLILLAGIGAYLAGVVNLLRAEQLATPQIACLVAVAFAWTIALSRSGSRSARIAGRNVGEYKAVLRATFATFGLMVVTYLVAGWDVPRRAVLTMASLGLPALLLSRYLWRGWLRRQRAVGRLVTRVLAVGDRRTVGHLIRDLHRDPLAGYWIVGVCVAGSDALPAHVEGIPVVCGVDDVAQTARALGVDVVAVSASGEIGPESVRKLAWSLQDSSASLVVAPAVTGTAGHRMKVVSLAGLSLIHLGKPAYRRARRALKRTLDVIGSAVLITIFSPVLIGTALAVKLTSAGPILFRQNRMGMDGQIFRMLKFRSMVNDAEQRLLTLNGAARDAGNEVLFKIKNDPRITAVGRFIRRFSVDELPQLFNVLAGQMSLVGPRPPLLSEVQAYDADAYRRLLVRPGMTGLWQVSGRSDLSWDESIRLDLYYIENWSMLGDVAILWKTAKAVFSSDGAY